MKVPFILHAPKQRTLPKPILKAVEREREVREHKASGSRERTEVNRRREALEVERRELEYAVRGAVLVPGAAPAESNLDDRLAEHDQFASELANDVELRESAWRAAQHDLHAAIEEYGAVVYEAAAKSERRVPEAVAAFPPIVPDWFAAIVEDLADRAIDRQLVEDLQRLMPKSRLAQEQRRQAGAYVSNASQTDARPEGVIGFLVYAILQYSRHLPQLADYWREHGVEPLSGPGGPILADSEIWTLNAGDTPRL